jgi:hypothetical protein
MVSYNVKGEKGVMLSRQALVLDERQPLVICFDGVETATAIINYECGDTVYRDLANGYCSIDNSTIPDGDIRITLAILDGSGKRWACDGLKAMRVGGCLIVSPNEVSVPEKVAKSELDIQEIKSELAVLRNIVNDINERITTILEGYDLV